MALCFPGQGSQASGMTDGVDAAALRPAIEAARTHGLDLAAPLGAGNDDALRPTEVAQPALVAVELALLDALPGAVEIVAVAGHSVGEYAAAAAAGALEPDEAMRLVVLRGRAMAAMHEGTMSAVLGLDAEAVAAVCAEVERSGKGSVVVANINAPGQTVVSGDVGAVAAVEALARDRGARRAVRLNVSGAFHSPLMRDAAQAFAQVLSGARIRDARVPLVCNVDAAPVTDASEIRERLERQLVSPVRWTECVARLVELGAEMIVEVGPGSVLTGLARRISAEVPAMSVNTTGAMRALAGTVVLS